MKKLIAILLAVAMLASMAVVASASTTMTMTTTVPNATYTVNIPNTLNVPYGAVVCDVPMPELQASEGFAGKRLYLYVSDYQLFGHEYGIDFDMELLATILQKEALPMFRGDYEYFYLCERGSGQLSPQLYTAVYSGYYQAIDDMFLSIAEDAWTKLPAGEHTGYITFGFEIR